MAEDQSEQGRYDRDRQKKAQQDTANIRNEAAAYSKLQAEAARYYRAVQEGRKLEADEAKDAIRELRDRFPEAWKRAGSGADEYRAAAEKAFTDTSRGVATMEDRINRTAGAMRNFLDISNEQSKIAAISMASRGQAYQFEGDINSLKEDMKWRRAIFNAKGDTSQIDERIAIKKAALEEKVNAASKKTMAAELQRRAVTSSASQGLTSLLSSDSGAFGKLAAKATESSGIVGKALGSVLKAETAAASGVAATGVSGAVAGGASVVIGSLAKALGPLSAALTSASLVGNVFMGIFRGIGETMEINVGQSRALATAGGNSFQALGRNVEFAKSEISSFAGVNTIAGTAINEAFIKDIVPGAQKAMHTFGTLDRSKATINAWTGALANVAIQGHSMGFSYEQSMGMAIKATDAFGGSAAKAKASFRDWVAGMKIAGLTAEQLEQSLGGLEDWGKRFGAAGQAEFMKDFAGRLKLAGVDSAAQRMLFGSSVSGMSKDMPRLLGLASASMGPKALDKYVDAVRGGPGALMNYTYKSQLGIMTGKGMAIDGMSPIDAIKRGSKEQAFRGAAGLSSVFAMPIETMLNKESAGQYMKMLEGATTEKGKLDLAQYKAEATGDWTEAGMRSIVHQQGLFQTLVSTVSRIGQIMEGIAEHGLRSLVTGGIPVNNANEEQMTSMGRMPGLGGME